MVAVELDGMLELAGKVLRGLAEWLSGRAEANCGTNMDKIKISPGSACSITRFTATSTSKSSVPKRGAEKW